MPNDKEMYLRVKNWPTKFENNRTRELKSLDWVPISNRMDTDEYVELLDHKEGPAHFAVWVACVMIASRCENPALRGVLVRDGGVPHTADTIARRCRIPAPTCGIAVERLLKMEWLERVHATKLNYLPAPHHNAGISHNGATKPQHGAGVPHPRARAGRTEQNTTNTPQPPSSEGGLRSPVPARPMTRAERRKLESIADIQRYADSVKAGKPQ